MVTLTLSQTLKFFESLPKMVFVVTSNPSGTTADSLWHTRPSVTSAYYAHTQSGAEKAYTIGGTVKKVTTSSTNINITTDTVTGLKRNFRFACGNNFPTALPDHQANCATITNGFLNITGAGTAFIVPTAVNSEELVKYLEEVTSNANKIRPTPWDTKNIRRGIQVQYLNDLMQHREPFGPRSVQKFRL